MTNRTISRIASTALLALGVWASTGLQAQQAPPAPQVSKITLTARRSMVLPTDFDITRIAVTDPAVADVTVVEAREILIDGKAPGTVTLIIWGEDNRAQYDVVVEPGVSGLQQQLQVFFPGEDIQVSETPDAVILTGHVSSNNVMLRSAEIAEAIAPKSKIINMLELPGGMESQQVLLQVRIAEVNKHAATDAGVSLFTGAAGYKDYVARATTEAYAAPNFTGSGPTAVTTISDLLNLFIFNTKYDVGTLIKALQSSGYFQSLAEPNLIAYNGKEASFLAGGELPIPVVSGATGTVSIVFKEYGVRLTFKPTIAGDVIRLHVQPEVSTLDFANGITLGGFRIPAISTRRAETEVELRDGQSFAIAGLMNNQAQQGNSMVPVLSALPIIGNLFKSKSTTKDRTELMVLVTPRLIRALNPDEVPSLPTMENRFLPSDDAPVKGSSAMQDGPAAGSPAADASKNASKKQKKQ